LFLTVTVASGTGGLRVVPEYLDPVSGFWRSPVNTLAASTIAVGMVPYWFGPGLGAVLNASINVGAGAAIPLVSQMRFNVLHVDASAYTYSLGYEAL
jgi:hypothetical protein